MAMTFKVEGMTCDGCARAVAQAIRKAVPGAEVTVERLSGRVTVEGTPREDDVGRAVRTAGFDYRGVIAEA
jgi:copper chaperone